MARPKLADRYHRAANVVLTRASNWPFWGNRSLEMAPRLRDSAPSIEDVLRLHEVRSFGQSGYREVSLEVSTKDEVTVAYSVTHIWQVTASECTSIYFLNKPSILKGTAVKVVERPRDPNLDIWLSLRTSKRPIHVDGSRSEESVLGTDFTYTDLRFWLPTDSYVLEGKVREEGLLTLSGLRKGENGGLARLLIKFDVRSWWPVSIELWGTPDAEPTRAYRAERLTQIDGVWTPQLMSVERARERYRSEMTLIRIKPNVVIDPRLLSTERLGALTACDFIPFADGSSDECS